MYHLHFKMSSQIKVKSIGSAVPELPVVCCQCHAHYMFAMKLKKTGKPIYTFFFAEFLNGFFISSPSKGPYSLNGYRVRVYRQDSATQWFTGIITHHDLFTRTMVVMNDQVSLIRDTRKTSFK